MSTYILLQNIQMVTNQAKRQILNHSLIPDLSTNVNATNIFKVNIEHRINSWTKIDSCGYHGLEELS